MSIATQVIFFLIQFFPDHFYCVVEGRGRLLHHDPSMRRPVTIAYSNPGDLIGWAGLVRRSPCEWATAATPLKLIRFTSDVFNYLESNSPYFRSWLDSNVSPAELISFLEPTLRAKSYATTDDREFLRRLAPHLNIYAARESRNLVDDNSLYYFWNTPVPEFNISVGDFVDLSLLSSIPSGLPLRIISVPKSLWDAEFSSNSHPIASLTSSTPVKNYDNHRYSNILDASATEDSESENDGLEKFYWRGKRVPLVTGIGPLEETIASLDMLSQYYNVPFRRDVIARIIRDSIKSSPPTLELLGNISTILGFIGSISDLPKSQLSRLAFPCFVFVDNSFVMIHGIDDTTVFAVTPSKGRIRFSVSQLLNGKEGIRVLTLSPGREAQQRKLNLSWFLPQISKYKRSLIEVLAASLVLQILNLAQPLVMQQIFDKVIVQQNLDTLYTLGVVLLGVSLFQGLIGAVRTYLFSDTNNRIDIALGAEVIHHLLRLPLRYFDKRPVGELQTRIAELGNIRGFLTGSLLTLALDSVFSVIYIAVMLIYSGTLTAVTLGVIPLFLGLTIFASPFIRNQLRKAAERNASTQSFLVESLNGVQTIKAQNAENTVRWQWQRRYSAFMSETFRSIMIGVSSGTVGSFLSQLTGLLTLWVGAYLVIQGDLTIGQLIAFRIISGYVVGPLLNLATSWQSFQSVALSLERLSDVIDAEPESGTTLLINYLLPPVSGDVTFQDVDFTFAEGLPLVVNRVSFHISSGSFVGIVGRSGSGKSTIMKLLPRLYQPTDGRILIDGFDIAKLQLDSVRRQIGIVPQDSLLFEGTIRDNICLINPDATSEDLIRAAKVACAHEFIMEQPQGYSTRVGERGSGLSGGQRQRIAIARAVLQRPSLLILDEATSALDYLTEKQVCLNLKHEFSGSTVFFITHRLSTIKSADLILMMESGRLVEQGSHQQLLRDEGRYFALYSQQESDID